MTPTPPHPLDAGLRDEDRAPLDLADDGRLADLTPEEATTPLTLDELRAERERLANSDPESDADLAQHTADLAALDARIAQSEAAVALIESEREAANEAKIAAQPDPPAEDELAQIPADETPTDALLAANGFASIRERLMGAAGGIEAVPVEVIIAVISFATSSRIKAKAAGASGEQLDAIDHDIEVLKLILHLRKRMKDLGEKRAARARLLGA